MLHTKAELEALQAAKPARQQRLHQGKKVRYEGTRMECPHCGAQCVIRHGSKVSMTMRKLVFSCTNAECGANYEAMTEFTKMLSVPARPNPNVSIPLSQHVRRGMLRVLLDNSPEAAHEPITPIEPITDDLFAGDANTS